jgi:hypothetical protein
MDNEQDRIEDRAKKLFEKFAAVFTTEGTAFEGQLDRYDDQPVDMILGVENKKVYVALQMHGYEYRFAANIDYFKMKKIPILVPGAMADELFKICRHTDEEEE